MIQTDELRGIITKRNMSQASVAKAIGITPKTFYGKMKKGIFGSDEIDKMISLLKIQNPAEIFLRVSNSKRYRIMVKSERRGENGNTDFDPCTGQLGAWYHHGYFEAVSFDILYRFFPRLVMMMSSQSERSFGVSTAVSTMK